jgi:O-antigen ligase
MAERIAVDESVLVAIKASPWLGYGYGAFEQAFPMFRGDHLAAHGIWEYAHNDWLEALMVLGVPAGLVLWLIFGWVLLRCTLGSLRLGSLCCTIASAVCLLTVLHSLVDFSLQIQGFALPVLAILGVGVSQSWPRLPAPSRATLHSSPIGLD